MDIQLKVTKKRSVIDGKIIEYFSFQAEIDGETVRFQVHPNDKNMFKLLMKPYQLPIVDD